jgi:hypothetical protein
MIISIKNLKIFNLNQNQGMLIYFNYFIIFITYGLFIQYFYLKIGIRIKINHYLKNLIINCKYFIEKLNLIL